MIKIVKDKNPTLRLPSKEVPLPLSDQDKQTLDEMLEYLKLSQDEAYRAKHPSVREGVGLAAPQIGVNKRMLVIHYCNDLERNLFTTYELVNPKIIANSIKKCYLESGEGCLSVDDEHKGYVYRDYKVTVKAYEALRGEEITIKAYGFDAIVLQHEIDHLSGVLFYDHIDKANPFKKVVGSVEI